MPIRAYQDHLPKIAASAYVDDSAVVIGDVVVSEDSSIWPQCVVRGDVNCIRIGARSNIQDGSIIHVTHKHRENPQGYATTIGDDVTVGHKVILHGCTIADRCLIGMGSIVLDGVFIHSQVLLGAGSLVAEGKELESGYLWLGRPARRVRPLTDTELAQFDYSAKHYVKLKNSYTR